MYRSPFFVVFIMCIAEVLTMLGVFTFPSLMPEFILLWELSNTEAGWIAGILLGGYALGVPALLSLTDRIDARLVYIFGATVTAGALFGFAYLSSGFWSALFLRILAGVGLAATYMPGLRIIVDRYKGQRQGRALAFYTACFSLGTAASFYFSGKIATLSGWPTVYIFAGLGALGSAFIVYIFTKPIIPQKPEVKTGLLDFRPIFKNHEAMGYIVAYCAHSWELFAMRSWLVAFLAFSLTLQSSSVSMMAPTVVATLSAFVAMVSSIVGNELADRYGRRRMITIFLLLASIFAFVIGFLAALPYWIIVTLALIYGGLIQLDSAALTAGAINAAEKGRSGSTLGLHALIGFSGAAAGPLVFGVILDLSGGGVSTVSWGYAFASIGMIVCFGPVALWKLRRHSLSA